MALSCTVREAPLGTVPAVWRKHRWRATRLKSSASGKRQAVPALEMFETGGDVERAIVRVDLRRQRREIARSRGLGDIESNQAADSANILKKNESEAQHFAEAVFEPPPGGLRLGGFQRKSALRGGQASHGTERLLIPLFIHSARAGPRQHHQVAQVLESADVALANIIQTDGLGGGVDHKGTLNG